MAKKSITYLANVDVHGVARLAHGKLLRDEICRNFKGTSIDITISEAKKDRRQPSPIPPVEEDLTHYRK